MDVIYLSIVRAVMVFSAAENEPWKARGALGELTKPVLGSFNWKSTTKLVNFGNKKLMRSAGFHPQTACECFGLWVMGYGFRTPSSSRR